MHLFGEDHHLPTTQLEWELKEVFALLACGLRVVEEFVGWASVVTKLLSALFWRNGKNLAIY